MNYKTKIKSEKIISAGKRDNTKKPPPKTVFEEGEILSSVAQKGGDKKGLKSDINITFWKKGVPLVEKMMFSRHLGVMIESGLPFDKSISVLENQTENSNLKKSLSQIKEGILKGESFSSALEKHPKIFNDLYVAMVKVGEETGNLREVLDTLSDQMEKDHKLISQVKGAMIYPAIILIIMFILGIVMMIMVIPQFAGMFDEMGAELPITTKIIVSLGEFLASYWYLIPVFIIVFIISVKKILKTNSGKKAADWSGLNLPIFGSLNVKINTARTCRILSSLLKSGVPIIKTLEILASTLTNVYYTKAIKNASENIQKGKTLEECLSPYDKLYPPLMIQMVEVGEKTGKLETILGRLAHFYEEEVDNVTKNLSTVIEPVLMVVIGIAVAVFVISLIQPMYSIMKEF